VSLKILDFESLSRKIKIQFPDFFFIEIMSGKKLLKCANESHQSGVPETAVCYFIGIAHAHQIKVK
jgi:hypothetical protein